MLCRRHKARHEYAQRFLAPMQDWVQLPTKVEMDMWRKKNEPGFKQLTFTSATWDVKRMTLKKVKL